MDAKLPTTDEITGVIAHGNSVFFVANNKVMTMSRSLLILRILSSGLSYERVCEMMETAARFSISSDKS